MTETTDSRRPTPDEQARIARLVETFNRYSAGTDVTATRPLVDAATALAPALPGFDPVTGTLAWQRAEDLDLVDADGWLDAGVEAAYWIHRLATARTVEALCPSYARLADAVCDLATWHDDYDVNTGRILP